MTEPRLLTIAAFSVASAIVYTFVGLRVGRRGLDADERLAMAMFKLWWYSLAAITLVTAGFSLSGAFRYTDLALYTTLLYVALIILCLALFGIGYYLAFLFTGRRAFLVPLAAFYGAFAVWLVYLVTAAAPTHVEVGRWQTQVQYAHPEALVGASTRGLLLLVFLPQVLGAIAYGSLYFRAEDRAVRYRIAMVSLSLLGWFGSSLLASALRFNAQDWWVVTSRFISLLASLLIYAAYRPPAWVERRLARDGRAAPRPARAPS